jgi:hypothetical protein
MRTGTTQSGPRFADSFRTTGPPPWQTEVGGSTLAVTAADCRHDEPLGWGPSRPHALGATVGGVASVEDPPPSGGNVTFCCRAKTGGMACIDRVK